MNIKIISAFLMTAVVVCGGAVYFLRNRGTGVNSNATLATSTAIVGEVHEVTLTDDGFVPETIEIAREDTVVWKTTRDQFFWPASDLHPTHLLYPEFDPKEPIDKGGTWSFRFDRVGEWKYHDHLSPYFTGIVRVMEKKPSGDSKP